MDAIFTIFMAIVALFCVCVVVFGGRDDGVDDRKLMDNVREWLLFAVTEAEKQYGSGMGKIKLRSVYDQFVVKFPRAATVLTFDNFSRMVDTALEEMKRLIEANRAIKDYIAV